MADTIREYDSCVSVGRVSPDAQPDVGVNGCGGDGSVSHRAEEDLYQPDPDHSLL